MQTNLFNDYKEISIWDPQYASEFKTKTISKKPFYKYLSGTMPDQHIYVQNNTPILLCLSLFRSIGLFFGISNSLAETKVVYVNMNRILTESKVGIFVEKHLTEIHKGNLDKFKKSEEALKKDEIDLISKRNIMAREEFDKKVAFLANLSISSS